MRNAVQEIAEFVLPPIMNGFQLQGVYDDAACVNWVGMECQAQISAPRALTTTPADMARLRGIYITIRGRTQSEDPKFTLTGYNGVLPFLNHGADLDGFPGNGLARVRSIQTVVDLRNMTP
jgi:hypothetical protein